MATETASARPATPAARPMVGLAGAAWVAAAFALLAIVTGAQTSLETIGVLTTFMLPVLVVSGVWWGGWPFRTLGQPLAGLLNTGLIAGLGIVLALLGQAIVGRLDAGGLFHTSTALRHGTFVGFPFTVPLAGLVFICMLQLTFVNGKKPLDRLPPEASGIAALAISWAAGFGLYQLTDWDKVVPPPAQVQIGLGNPGGPVDALHLLGWSLCVACWQVVLFILLQGKPFAGVKPPAARIVLANVAPVALGWLMYALFKHGFSWSVPRVAAISACVIAASLVAGMLMEGWPAAAAASPAAQGIGIIITALTLTLIAYFGLKGLGNGIQRWNRDPAELWVAVCGLNYIAAVVILHVAVWGRWPLARPAPPPSEPL